MTDPRVLEGPIRQIGYIVRDLDAAIESWCALGVGPWFTMRDLEQQGCSYRGEPCAPTLSLGFSHSASVQVELIQQMDDGPSIYREFLDAKGPGYHQLAWWVRDFDEMQRKADAAGWPVVFSGGQAGSVRFAYFELDTTISTIVEVMELTEASQGLHDIVAGAAATWDGVTDPVRSLG